MFRIRPRQRATKSADRIAHVAGQADELGAGRVEDGARIAVSCRGPVRELRRGIANAGRPRRARGSRPARVGTSERTATIDGVRNPAVRRPRRRSPRNSSRGRRAGPRSGVIGCPRSAISCQPRLARRLDGHAPAAAGRDVADRKPALPGVRPDLRGAREGPPGDTKTTIPIPMLKTRCISSKETSPSRCDDLEDRRHRPRARLDDDVEPLGQHARDVVVEAAAGDVRHAVDEVGVEKRLERAQVGEVRIEQHVGDRRPPSSVESDPTASGPSSRRTPCARACSRWCGARPTAGPARRRRRRCASRRGSSRDPRRRRSCRRRRTRPPA